MKYCQHCGSPVSDNARICTVCGRKPFDTSAGTNSAPVGQPAPAAPQQSPAPPQPTYVQPPQYSADDELRKKKAFIANTGIEAKCSMYREKKIWLFEKEQLVYSGEKSGEIFRLAYLDIQNVRCSTVPQPEGFLHIILGVIAAIVGIIVFPVLTAVGAISVILGMCFFFKHKITITTTKGAVYVADFPRKDAKFPVAKFFEDIETMKQ